MAVATQSYKGQVEAIPNKAYGDGYLLGLKAAGVPETSELHQSLPNYPK